MKRFLLDTIDSVPELDTLLLLWRDPQRSWSPEEVSTKLHLPKDQATAVLHALERGRFARRSDEPTPFPRFQCETTWDSGGELLADLSAAFTDHLVEIRALIQARASPSVRELARAFDLKARR